MTDLDKTKPSKNRFMAIKFDPSPLKASLKKHAPLLRDHGQLESTKSTLATLVRGFKTNRKAVIAKSKGISPYATEAKLESLADKMLARGHQIIDRAIENCEDQRAFKLAYQASVTRHGALCTAEEVARKLNVSPWHVDAIMRRAGAKKVRVAGVGERIARGFWRLDDCQHAQQQRELN